MYIAYKRATWAVTGVRIAPVQAAAER
jgi:hypothetical protein